MEQWDRDYIDLVVPGHFTVEKNGQGAMQFGVVGCDLDCRIEELAGIERLEFSFIGEDEGDTVVGRGWAILEGDKLIDRIVFHCGDESGFVASKQE